MSPDPWDLIGWMIIGGVAGVALGQVLQGLRESLDDISRAFGWKGIVTLLAVATLAGLWLFGPFWLYVFVLAVTVVGVLVWRSGRSMKATTNEEVKP